MILSGLFTVQTGMELSVGVAVVVISSSSVSVRDLPSALTDFLIRSQNLFASKDMQVSCQAVTTTLLPTT